MSLIIRHLKIILVTYFLIKFSIFKMNVNFNFQRNEFRCYKIGRAAVTVTFNAEN